MEACGSEKEMEFSGIYFSGKLSHTISPKKSRPETEKSSRDQALFQ